jgi:hypothetical protein
MTFSAGLLLALEPSPISPGAGAKLLSTQQTIDPHNVLFDTSPEQAWSGIVIHDSGSLEGSLASIDKVHAKMGLGGAGYHFVVDNGRGGPDGQIEMGYRWKQQMAGQHTTGPHAEWFNRSAIGICFVGNSDQQAPTHKQTQELLWLVRELQEKFNIPASRVYIQTGSGNGASLFPAASFRQQLLTVR